MCLQKSDFGNLDGLPRVRLSCEITNQAIAFDGLTALADAHFK
jgi:hypothetical protein